jgi:sulfatase modifying factor 1
MRVLRPRPRRSPSSWRRCRQLSRRRVGLADAAVVAAVVVTVVAGLSEPARGSLGSAAPDSGRALGPLATVLGPRVELDWDPAATAPVGMTLLGPTAVATAAMDLARNGGCPAQMLEVKGDYCPAVVHHCIRWISQRRDRCAEYAVSARCFGRPVAKHFCIDKYEFPNQRGVVPEVGMTWEEARDRCETLGKRLCTSSEWTVACEGPERTPYPDGYRRGACNQDRPYIFPDDAAFRNPATRPEEIERLRQSHPSGVRAGCVSHYGVYDLTGNVDEWVINEQGSVHDRPYRSGLKGGYWGPVRNRCRPMTVDHNAWHAGYQIGFRCCADPRHGPSGG